ncbi:MAG: hypothetical protein NDJ92_02210 [Thermoanaerobaculia bacterium]|nr:hypothetical protein [Thermoanaerobaculia bacterium]
MRSKLVLFWLAVALVPASVVAAQSQPGERQRVLVPLAFAAGTTVPGAYGTVWIGEVWVANESSEDIQTLRSQQCQQGCPDPELPAKSQRAISALPPGERSDAGAFLYVPGYLAADVFFSARVLEVTRRAQPTGFAVPVVRESDYFTTAVMFPGVPAGAAVRSSLRIYDATSQGGRAFLVEMVGENGDTIASIPVTLSDGTSLESLDLIPASVAVHNLENVLAGDTGVRDLFHIRISPIGDVSPYWAFVSVTDNETQHVLMITAD